MKALTALKSSPKDTTPGKTKHIKVTKIIAKDPLAIGGRPQGTIRDIVPEDYPRVTAKPTSNHQTSRFGNPKSNTTNPTSTISNYSQA